MEDNYPMQAGNPSPALPHLHISQELLPEVKSFKPGESYTLEVQFNVREVHLENGMGDPEKELGCEGKISSIKLLRKRKKKYNDSLGGMRGE